MQWLTFAMLWLSIPAAAAASAGSIYLLPDALSFSLSDDGSIPNTVLLAEGRALKPTLPLRVDAWPQRKVEPALAINAAVAAASRRYGVSAALIQSVIGAESGFRARAVSPRGALGLMQLMPETARSYGVVDPFDVASNVDAGTRHLRMLIERFGPDTTLVLAAYNAGAEAVARHGNRMPPYAETIAYVPRVLHRLARFGTSEINGAGILAGAFTPETTRP